MVCLYRIKRVNILYNDSFLIGLCTFIVDIPLSFYRDVLGDKTDVCLILQLFVMFDVCLQIFLHLSFIFLYYNYVLNLYHSYHHVNDLIKNLTQYPVLSQHYVPSIVYLECPFSTNCVHEADLVCMKVILIRYFYHKFLHFQINLIIDDFSFYFSRIYDNKEKTRRYTTSSRCKS